MSRLQEIKTSIGSVKSTKKITRAYYLISAAKSKKAKIQLETVRPYFNRIASCLADILAHSNEVNTPYIGHSGATEDKGNLYIVVAGDKGMAGAYNHNIINMMSQHVDKEKDTVMVAGGMGRSQIIRKGFKVDEDFKYQVMNPSIRRAKEIAGLVVEKYLAAEYHEVHIIYTLMITPLKQVPISVQLLPLKPDEHAVTHVVTETRHTISYEPSPWEVFDHLVPHFVKGIIYGAFVEAFTSEQNARMYAMENATKNADDLIAKLTLNYNRARQAVITQEINEIVGGIPAD